MQGELAGGARGAPRPTGGFPSPRGSAGWCQRRAGVSLDSTERSPCLLITHTHAEINPSDTKARGTEPGLLLKSMRLFTAPVSHDFHPFKGEAGLAAVSDHHPGERPLMVFSPQGTIPSCKISSGAHPTGLGCAEIRCFILSNLQLPWWASHNAPPGNSPPWGDDPPRQQEPQGRGDRVSWAL